MKSISILSVAALSLCMLTGCGGGESTPAVEQDDLIGTWVEKLDDGSETLTLRADGTYHKLIKLGGSYPISTETDDKWTLEGATITIYMTEFNTAVPYTVSLSEDKNTMVWDRDDNRIVYSRKK